MMELEEKIEYWVDNSDYDFKTARSMQRSGRYVYTVIMCQQSIGFSNVEQKESKRVFKKVRGVFKMAESNIDKIKRYLTDISKICKIDEAYIFGSFVHTNDIEKSDIDLAIISDTFNEENFIDYLSQFLIISARSRLNIEPHLFNPEDLEEDFVQGEVIAKGVRISL